MFTAKRYPTFKPLNLPNRQWPNRSIEKAPLWCSVDLRDGNQALINPMTVEQKQALFEHLLELGFKHIEVGFPAASQTDFDFVRQLIEQDKIPEDVVIQVLTQARDDLIKRSFEALQGAKQAIVHVYNSTSPVQRDKVFKLDKSGIVDIAIHGAQKVLAESKKYPQTQWQFQYSPESFSQTETDFAVEVCNAVIDVWQGSGKPITINLPATVEAAMPNIFADQVEYFCQHIKHRQDIIVSVHTHNDRGCAVAAAEMAVLAGADRVEGTLLGNGERTGNMDIITMAMNLYSQGIEPNLYLENMAKTQALVERCTQIATHPRHPYVGELVFTAFSGSHQDAIKKCLAQQSDSDSWNVAYLPIDPNDIGRSYEAVIRINSQSGKGGVAYIIEQALGIELSRQEQIQFSRFVQSHAEQTGEEVSQEAILMLFQAFNKNSVAC